METDKGQRALMACELIRGITLSEYATPTNALFAARSLAEAAAEHVPHRDLDHAMQNAGNVTLDAANRDLAASGGSPVAEAGTDFGEGLPGQPATGEGQLVDLDDDREEAAADPGGDQTDETPPVADGPESVQASAIEADDTP